MAGRWSSLGFGPWWAHLSQLQDCMGMEARSFRGGPVARVRCETANRALESSGADRGPSFSLPRSVGRALARQTQCLEQQNDFFFLHSNPCAIAQSSRPEG
jgi:hypothetical protein